MSYTAVVSWISRALGDANRGYNINLNLMIETANGKNTRRYGIITIARVSVRVVGAVVVFS